LVWESHCHYSGYWARLSLAGLALMGVAIALKIGLSFYGVVIVIVLLLASASQNAWALLIQADDPMEPDKAGAE
jgi:hypothetical protein